MPDPSPSLVVSLAVLAAAAIPAQGSGYSPTILGPSKEGELALSKFTVDPDLAVSLWAAEPMLANPVAFWVDAHGRAFVAETFRLHKGVTDNRRYGEDWIEAELACRSVEDRIAQYRRFFPEKIDEWTREHERIRLLTDDDGDGRADRATVFADGFHRLEHGIAAGVLEHEGHVYFTCIPELWRLRDRDGDGVADEREVLHTGYGVHTALLGHDMHGLIVGPDGRLYFSIGDRGLRVTTREGGTIDLPDEGAVLRCEPDGSGLEVFHRGLRNPQELAFDDFGNLFTGDNNSDGGDRARFVYLMEGGDCGWRIGFQTLADRGPWNREKLWHPPFRGQAAYLAPPVANYASGPSGLCFDPGTGLPERWRGHFLLCDFRGSSSHSGVFALRVVPHGAGFELVGEQPVIRGVLPTDVMVGPDGAVWLTDWTEGWEQTGKGRIYRITAKDGADPRAAEVARLLREGMRGRPVPDLVRLLAHADRRVRQAAQFALAAAGEAEALHGVAADRGASSVQRAHAAWALGQIARARGADVLAPLLPLLRDADHEVRAQVARVCGDVRFAAAGEPLRAALRDRSSRVRSLAAIALGRIGDPEAVASLVRAARENDDRDPWLRHALTVGLAGSGDASTLLAHAGDESVAVRLALCVALRRQASPHVARFLDDPEPLVAVEAARAIHDVPIPAATPALAAVLNRREVQDEALVRRAIAACYRLGDAGRLATFASRADADGRMRVLALDALADWAHPSARDRVLDLWRPIPDRGPEAAREALALHARALLRQRDAEVAAAAARAVGALGLAAFAADLERLARDEKRGGKARAAALAALEQVAPEAAQTAAASLAVSSDAALRKSAVRVVTRLDPDAAVGVLESLVRTAPLDEQQNALQALGESPSPLADVALLRWLERMAADEVPPELHLDVLEAAGKRKDPEVAARLAARERALAPWREALAGGDAERGERVFWNHETAVCTRCHALKDSGGNAGPALDHVGSTLTREQLLEALVLPQARIAEGFGTVVVERRGARALGGVLKRDDGDLLVVQTPEGELVEVRAADVVSRSRPVSAMPPMGAILTKRELRDLVEFLASLVEKPEKLDAAASAGGR